jgi:hypothetical protein
VLCPALHMSLPSVERALRSVRRWTSLAPGEAFSSTALLVAAFIALAYGAALLGVRVWYEALGPYNVDTPLYWTVGRWMLHGLVPYRDLYETKPPGIFMLSAVSYLLTSGFGLTHVTQIFSLLFVALAPLAYVPKLVRTRSSALLDAPVFLSLWAVVLLIAAYVADRGSAVQVETHGLVGVVGYTLLLGKPGRNAFLGRALGALVCIGMKEPFFLSLVAAYLVTTPTVRRLWSDLVGPLALASVVGTIVLLTFGWFTAYTRIYLKSMLGAHVNLAGTPVSRTVTALDLTWNNVQEYSTLLPALLVYCMGVYLFLPDAGSASPLGHTGQRFQALVLGLLLVGLAVGMGGTFYEHHYIFALPVLLATLFVLMARCGDGSSAHTWLRAGFVGLALATVCVKWTPAKVYRERAAAIAAQDAAARESAEVIDSLMDRLHVDRYLFLGPGGYMPFAYTRHAPLGPLFFQQVMFFEGHYPWFVKQFRRRLDEAQVVVMHEHFTGSLDDEVRAKLAADFRVLPPGAILAGKRAQDPILIRKGLAFP